MRHILTQQDRECLAIAPEPRWKKNANWRRYNMVENGHLRSASRHGIWEISDLGRAYLRQLRGEH